MFIFSKNKINHYLWINGATHSFIYGASFFFPFYVLIFSEFYHFQTHALMLLTLLFTLVIFLGIYLGEKILPYVILKHYSSFLCCSSLCFFLCYFIENINNIITLISLALFLIGFAKPKVRQIFFQQINNIYFRLFIIFSPVVSCFILLFSFKLIFIFEGFFILLLVFIIHRYQDFPHFHTRYSRLHILAGLKYILSHFNFIQFYIISILIYAIFIQFYFTLPLTLIAQYRENSILFYAIILIAAHFILILFSKILKKIISISHPERHILTSAIILIICLILIGIVRTISTEIVTLLLWPIAYLLLNTSMNLFIILKTPLKLKKTLSFFYGVSVLIGMSIGIIFASLIIEEIGIINVWIIFSITSILVAFLIIFLVRFELNSHTTIRKIMS